MENSKISIFLGAGVSRNSGVPTVQELLQNIIPPFPFIAKDLHHILNSKFQFEKLIELISNHFDIKCLFEVFNSKLINNNHLLISSLCKVNLIDCILTTNFDTLLEQALNKKLVKYNVISSSFNEGELSSSIVNIIKLHGDLTDVKSLGIQLRSITNQKVINSLGKLIRRVLKRKSSNYIFFLGYSFSDYYDILPALKKFSSKRNNYFVIEHSQSKRIQDLEIYDGYFELFPKRTSTVIKYNTDELIKSFQVLLFDKEKVPFICYNGNMNDKFRPWADQIRNSSNYEKLFVCAEILKMLYHNKRALIYYKKAQKAASTVKEHLNIETKIANINLKIGNTELAKKLFHTLIEKYTDIQDHSGIANCSLELGNVYRQIGKYDEAILYFGIALRYSRKTKNLYEIQNINISIGNCYIGSGNFKKAKLYLNKATPIILERGDMTNYIINCFSLFSVNIKLNSINNARDLLTSIKDQVYSFGNERFKAIFIFNEGVLFERKELFNEAILKYNSAYRLSKKIKDTYSLFLILKNRSFCNYQIKKYQNTIDDVKESMSYLHDRYNSQKRIIVELKKLLKKAEAKIT